MVQTGPGGPGRFDVVMIVALVDNGSLAPAAHANLRAAAGLLSSEVEPSVSGPPRRYYRITKPGREVLREWVAAWNATRDSVDNVLQGGVS